uniref:Putative ribonuclease H-like domain-containing protein n=1 Tax=Tanacetum cinerariifolium TaxID=118510 RepID=A0A6L2N3T3_TANCI|nr:putative ribonuclease H-like domain-containing protein [Tanacetum cinerariifolium]
MTRALITESNVPKTFWPEALATATYLISRLPTKILKMKTTLETLTEYHTLPQVLTLEPKVFGCTVFAHIPKTYRDKLDLCAEKCVFVGYGVNQNGYRFYNPKTRHMFTTMNCDFLETKYFYSSQHSGTVISNISVTEDTIPNLISEEHEEPTLTEVEEPTLTEVPKKYVLPARKKPVGCRWIFTIKYKPDGTVERYKARLVSKGYTQTYRIDYSKTFSPVAKIDTIRDMFLIAANQGWPLHQFDVKNAFLHEELKKSIYGGPAWILSAFQTWRSLHRGDHVTCLIIYVDEMIITENDESEIKKLKEGLCAEFEMKELGNLRYFLRIEVMRSPQGIFICQKKYILDLLAETVMIDCKPADTPMTTNDHMHAVLRIVRYLKGTTSHGMLFKTNGYLNIQIFTDADWAEYKGNKRSTSGYFSLVGEALWIRKLMSETGFPPKESIRIMSDNKAAI